MEHKSPERGRVCINSPLWKIWLHRIVCNVLFVKPRIELLELILQNPCGIFLGSIQPINQKIALSTIFHWHDSIIKNCFNIIFALQMCSRNKRRRWQRKRWYMILKEWNNVRSSALKVGLIPMPDGKSNREALDPIFLRILNRPMFFACNLFTAPYGILSGLTQTITMSLLLNLISR